jgi:hypothetical protein
MATYPIVLYPKLITDFRQKYGHLQQEVPLSVVPKAKEVVREQRQRLDALLVFVRRLLAWGLVIVGIVLFGKPLGLVALLGGAIALMVPLVLGRNRQVSLPKHPGKLLSLNVPPKPDPEIRDELKVYFSALASTMKGKVLQPDGVTDAPIGASEKAFGQILETFFPGRVKAQLRLAIPDWERAYSTDFTVSFPELGIWIDVEIDEPYDYRTGKPTHCIDDDCHRNSFFLKNNWIVVRFSEEQVVRYPESCCLELAGVIQRVTKIQRYSAALSEVPPLIPLPMWTSRLAKKMAKAKTRDTYLRAIKLKA